MPQYGERQQRARSSRQAQRPHFKIRLCSGFAQGTSATTHFTGRNPDTKASLQMRIVIGGAGGYVGAQLARAGEDVIFIARGEHLSAIRTHGLCIETPAGEIVIRPALDRSAIYRGVYS
jgi:Ketopantoate reductase PanE/ApbA